MLNWAWTNTWPQRDCQHKNNITHLWNKYQLQQPIAISWQILSHFHSPSILLHTSLTRQRAACSFLYAEGGKHPFQHRWPTSTAGSHSGNIIAGTVSAVYAGWGMANHQDITGQVLLIRSSAHISSAYVNVLLLYIITMVNALQTQDQLPLAQKHATVTSLPKKLSLNSPDTNNFHLRQRLLTGYYQSAASVHGGKQPSSSLLISISEESLDRNSDAACLCLICWRPQWWHRWECSIFQQLLTQLSWPVYASAASVICYWSRLTDSALDWEQLFLMERMQEIA